MNKFRNSLLIGTSIIVSSFIVFGVAAYFFSEAITAEAEKISEDRATINRNNQLISGLAEQKTIDPEVQKFTRAINLLLPTKDDLVNFSSWLNGLSRVYNIGVNFSFNGDAVSPEGDVAGFIRFTLNASGNYSDLVNFLRDVEMKDPRYTVSFDGFDLKRSGGDYQAGVSGRVFFR